LSRFKKSFQDEEKLAKKFDIRNRTGYRVQILANKMILWSSRTYARKFNVGVQEWRVLRTAKIICDYSLMDKGNVSRAVKRLVNDGCLKERPDKTDRRSTVLVLTPKGYDLYSRIKKVSDAREKQFMTSLSGAEQKALPKILTNLEGVIEDLLQESEKV
jgi:DNA-binding MarR family transcriptional regulator